MRRILQAAVLAALVALGVRLWVLHYGHDLPPDGVHDLEIARHLQKGELEPALLEKFHPLEGALAAAVATALGREADETCGLIVSVAGGVFAVFCAALAAGLLASKPPSRPPPASRGEEIAPASRGEEMRPVMAALSAGILAAGHPELALSSTTVWSYPVAHAALAAALLAALLAMKSPGWAFFAGLAAGAGYLARPDGLVVAAGLAVAVLAGAPGRLRALGLLVVGFAILAVPYVSALHGATHEWRLTLKKDERHLVGMRDLQAPPPPPRPKEDLQAIIEATEGQKDPEELDYGASALFVLGRSATAIHPLLAVLGLVGLATMRGRRRIPGLGVLVAFFAAHVLLKRNEHDFSSHHASAEALIFAAWSGIALAPLARRRRVRTLAVALCFVVLVAKARDAHRAIKGDLARQVARYLRTGPGTVCGHQALPVAFLAGARYVPLPRGNAETVVATAHAVGARWLVLYVRTRGEDPAPVKEALAFLPGPAPFADSREAPEGHTILYTWLVYDLSRDKR